VEKRKNTCPPTSFEVEGNEALNVSGEGRVFRPRQAFVISLVIAATY